MSGLRPAVFIDRDGTVIEERVYLSDPDGVVLFPGALEALRTLRDAGFALVLVTNQAGISKGHYSVKDYHAGREEARRYSGRGWDSARWHVLLPTSPRNHGPLRLSEARSRDVSAGGGRIRAGLREVVFHW